MEQGSMSAFLSLLDEELVSEVVTLLPQFDFGPATHHLQTWKSFLISLENDDDDEREDPKPPNEGDDIVHMVEVPTCARVRQLVDAAWDLFYPEDVPPRLGMV